MRKYHSHTLLYLHETIALGSGTTDRFTEVFVDTYQPMMEELGARLFCLWETTPYNGHWPQVTIIWEIDAFADYARIGAAQARRDMVGSAIGRPHPRTGQRTTRPAAAPRNIRPHPGLWAGSSPHPWCANS
jgi:hypothetical protein